MPKKRRRCETAPENEKPAARLFRERVRQCRHANLTAPVSDHAGALANSIEFRSSSRVVHGATPHVLSVASNFDCENGT
jgi:hypothetical protein